MKEKLKTISIGESEYNQLTLIAHKEGLLWKEGKHSGKMNVEKTMRHVMKLYADVTA